ncbi:hypothetical protein ACJA25_01560 [Mycoplasmopsis hyopharyngis]|uniref:hypothetical protein n=1 Tax=Mycoplasmopsis hyopharyngis TaxID=29558 RepID=UPI003873162D
MPFEYRIILDFEAISSNFVKRLPRNKNIKTYDVVYCVSFSISNLIKNKKQYSKFLFSELQNKDIYEIENELFWKMITYIYKITNTNSIDQIIQKVEFYGWNPELENQFFKRIAKKNKLNPILVNHILPNCKSRFSLDKITTGTKYSHCFFKFINDIVPNYYEKNKDRPGYLAAVLGYIIFCKNHSIVIKEKSLEKIAQNTTNKILWSEILQYSNSDVFKTVYMFKQIKKFDNFTKDYLAFSQMLKKQFDQKMIPIKMENKYLKNILKILNIINKYKKYDFQNILKFTIDLNNPNFVDSIIKKINLFTLKNSNKDLNDFKLLIESFEYNKKEQNYNYFNLDKISNVIEENNKKIKQYEDEKKNKNIMFIESFSPKYVAIKSKEKWWLKLI